MSATSSVRLPRQALLTLITAHIAISVGLLGDSAGFLAVAIRRAASEDGSFREATLVLIVSVIVVGATLISPVLHAGSEPNDATLVVAGAWDVFALLVATGLAVVKPGKRRRPQTS